MAITNLPGGLTPEDVLAYEFFREFARCEYCLKAVGFVVAGRDAKADWGMFSDSVVGVFESPSEQLALAIQYYLKSPPKKQVVREGSLHWDHSPPTARSQADLILLLVRRVRNNLFHGGKFNGHWFAPQRSRDLLRHGLIILHEVILANSRTREAYENRATYVP